MATTLLALALVGALGLALHNLRIVLIAAMVLAFLAQPAGFLSGATAMALLLWRGRRPP